MREEAYELITEYLEKESVDAYFVSRTVNVRYVSGYTSDDAYLFLTRNKKYLITDPRYTELAAAECPDYELIDWRGSCGSVAAAVAFAAKENGCRTIGYEEDSLTSGMFIRICEALLDDAGISSYSEESRSAVTPELIPADGLIEEMRKHKNPWEIKCARAASMITVRAFERILHDIRPGVTEKELAANLSRYMVLEGADTMPYGNILISGARTSLLHGVPSDKAVAYGDFVLMDFGCQFHGYMSDMTRTVVVGKADERQREVYRLEQQMVKETEEFILPGRKVKDAYEVSTRAIRETEYYPYHYAGIGHGVGLFVHEHPFMGPRSEDVFEENTIMTVEPGIYIPGWGGVRIEDTVLIKADGIENLTPAGKELIEL